MKILGIDTSTKFLSLGIYNNGRACEYNLELGRKHSSLLAVTIKRTLDAVGLQIGDIDYFACGLGPGSFTGVRIGLSTIKGFAWALNKPVIGISTLDILARDIVNINEKPVVPAIDAKRGLIYCSVYKVKKGAQKRIAPYMLLTQEEFFKKIKPNPAVFGDATELYKAGILKNIKGAIILEKDYWYPKGHNIIALALERIKEKKFKSPMDVNPIYLYPKECQIKSVTSY